MSATSNVEQGPAFDRFTSVTDLPMTLLTLAWLPVLVVPLVQPVHGTVATSFDVVDACVWSLFAFEYLARLWLARHRGTYVRTHLLDLLVVAVPFFRPLRLLRLVRLAQLERVVAVAGAALKRFRAILTHKGLHIVLLAAGALLVACAGLVTLAERHARGANIHDFGQGLWWAVVTVTTVGYGDRYPVTPAGQGIAVFLMLMGIGLIGVLTASVASFFVEETKDAREDELAARLDRIELALAELARGSTGHGAVPAASTDGAVNGQGAPARGHPGPAGVPAGD